MKAFLKRTAILLLVGAGLGLIASMWFGPGVIEYWYVPPGQAAVLVDISKITEATTALVRLQLGVGIALGLLLAVGGNYVAWKRAKSAAVEPSSPPAPAPGPQPTA